MNDVGIAVHEVLSTVVILQIYRVCKNKPVDKVSLLKLQFNRKKKNKM